VLLLVRTHLQNWGKELKLWLGERVVPVVVDDTRADHVKKSFQVGAATLCRCWSACSVNSINSMADDEITTACPYSSTAQGCYA
jgi:hypothetical protein